MFNDTTKRLPNAQADKQETSKCSITTEKDF